MAHAEAALSVVHAEYPWYPLWIHARLGILLWEAIVYYLCYEIYYTLLQGWFDPEHSWECLEVFLVMKNIRQEQTQAHC